MRFRVLVLGGYGTFGERICRSLSADPAMRVVVAGRDGARASRLATRLQQEYPGCGAECLTCDTGDNRLGLLLATHRIDAVINTAGPFQGQDYRVARACITAGSHYIDLADARDYVNGFTALDSLAREHGVLAVTGASSVPALSAAVVDSLSSDLRSLRSIEYGITPGNRTPRGIATVRSILSYCGQPFRQWRSGEWRVAIGWQGLIRHHYPAPLGTRWMSYCDIPDLAIFPARYPGVRDVIFRAGLELSVLHLGTWLLSWLARAGLVRNWASCARPLTRMSEWLQSFGTDVGGMHVTVSGTGEDGRNIMKTWTLIAHRGDGPQVPCLASILLARKLARRERMQRGAVVCVGILSLDDFSEAMNNFSIEQRIVSSFPTSGA